jgi:hypothetical protein
MKRCAPPGHKPRATRDVEENRKRFSQVPVIAKKVPRHPTRTGRIGPNV